mmetsp:Transcript_7496/g.24446  ORF Transcript_7496/g.24446 Transcript_7496/m.24446 type:complete len:215 (+) Transcript_7496:853-1497(+)
MPLGVEMRVAFQLAMINCFLPMAIEFCTFWSSSSISALRSCILSRKLSCIQAFISFKAALSVPGVCWPEDGPGSLPCDSSRRKDSASARARTCGAARRSGDEPAPGAGPSKEARWPPTPTVEPECANCCFRVVTSLRKFSINVTYSDTWWFTSSTLRWTCVLMFLARFAYFKVFNVSSNEAFDAEMFAIITVRQLPPKESFNSRVSLESLYGTN